MAFGDYLNAIEMWQAVGLGIAMGNGDLKTKESANYVTDSHDRNGIEKALQHFDVIDK